MIDPVFFSFFFFLFFLFFFSQHFGAFVKHIFFPPGSDCTSNWSKLFSDLFLLLLLTDIYLSCSNRIIVSGLTDADLYIYISGCCGNCSYSVFLFSLFKKQQHFVNFFIYSSFVDCLSQESLDKWLPHCVRPKASLKPTQLHLFYDYFVCVFCCWFIGGFLCAWVCLFVFPSLFFFSIGWQFFNLSHHKVQSFCLVS